MYKIEFYKSPSGSEPVKEWFEQLLQGGTNEVDLFDVVKNCIEMLRTIGPMLKRPHSGTLARLDYLISELIIKHSTGQYRILYSSYEGIYVLLHFVKKKQRAIDRKDIDIANRRMKLWVRSYNKRR